MFLHYSKLYVNHFTLLCKCVKCYAFDFMMTFRVSLTLSSKLYVSYVILLCSCINVTHLILSGRPACTSHCRKLYVHYLTLLCQCVHVTRLVLIEGPAWQTRRLSSTLSTKTRTAFSPKTKSGRYVLFTYYGTSVYYLYYSILLYYYSAVKWSVQSFKW